MTLTDACRSLGTRSGAHANEPCVVLPDLTYTGRWASQRGTLGYIRGRIKGN